VDSVQYCGVVVGRGVVGARKRAGLVAGLYLELRRAGGSCVFDLAMVSVF